MDGILLVAKEEGVTSYHVVERIKAMVRGTKVGHGGTLDPTAKGLLIILMGRATRLFNRLSFLKKHYLGEIMLGVETETYDREGLVIKETPLNGLTSKDIDGVLRGFCGKIQQRPPRYSAVKAKGKRAYQRARAGEDFQMEPREVVVHSIELVECNLPFVRVEVWCGKGFYMRSLAHDLGERLGVGGHLHSLTRLGIGPFSIEEAISLTHIGSLRDIESSLIDMERLKEFLKIEEMN